MTKRPTTITYVDTHTGRTHTFNADVAVGATRQQVQDTIARANRLPAGRVRIVSGA